MTDSIVVELPEHHKQLIHKIQADLENYQKVSQVILASVQQTPSRSDVLAYMDTKINSSDAQKQIEQLTALVDESKIGQSELKKHFEHQIQLQQQSVMSLQEQSKMALEFERDYAVAKKEIVGLRKSGEEMESKARQNLADYQSEQSYIKKTFQQLKTDVDAMCSTVSRMNSAQMVLNNRAEELQKGLARDYTSLNSSIVTANQTLQTIVRDVPLTVANAKSELREEMKSIIQTERQRRQIEQSYFSGQLLNLQNKLDAADAGLIQADLQMKAAINTFTSQIEQQLGGLKLQFNTHLDRQQAELHAVNTRLAAAVQEQHQQIQKLNQFETVFRQADAQWKQSVQSVHVNTEQYVKFLEEKIDTSEKKASKQLLESVTHVEETRKEANGLKNTWETEWRKKEILYDDQLLRLKGLGTELKQAVQGESMTRRLQVKEVQDKIKHIETIIQQKLKEKADVDWVKSELDKKLDKD